MNTIHLIGINHKTAAVQIREKFALKEFCSPETWAIPLGNGISESLILSTCNRVEVLVVGKGEEAGERAKQLWLRVCGQELTALDPYIYRHVNKEAVRHVFNVASSLDSLVLGEPQILGQLKDAYRKSVENHSAGIIINRLLHKAFSVAKRVRTETGVASSAVSISYAAVELAKQIFDDMPQHNALIIGAGEMAELSAAYLVQAGIKKLRVANRTFEKAEEIAERLNGEPIPFDDLFDILSDTDIIISSTGAPSFIIYEKDIKSILKKRKNRPMFFIDIAMPRDIDPAVNNLDNIYLYDIDDLKEVVEEHLAGRKEEAIKGKKIVNEETSSFMEWIDSLSLQPTIVALGERGKRIMQEELAKTIHRLGNPSDEVKEALDIMADSIVRRFNHDPISFMKDRFHEAENPEYTQQAVDTIRRVFKLD